MLLPLDLSVDGRMPMRCLKGRTERLRHATSAHAREHGIAYGREPYGDGALVVVRGRESRPHGEGGQVSVDQQRMRVREMRSAETCLAIIRTRGERRLPIDDLYRQLFNPEFYLQAQGRFIATTVP